MQIDWPPSLGFKHHATVRYFFLAYQVLKNMTSDSYGDYLRHKINDSRTFQDYKYYGDFYSSTNVGGTSHLSIISPDGDAVAATNTINL